MSVQENSRSCPNSSQGFCSAHLQVDPEVTPLNINSVRDLEFRLGESREDLRACARHAGALYSAFPNQPKQRPFQKKNLISKPRTIDNPIEPLKSIQRKIYKKLLRPITLPPHIFGGVQDQSALKNAALHLRGDQIVKIDIRKFFPSITPRHVYYVWRDVLNCSTEIAALLTQLTTVDGHVATGASTSTALGSILLCSIDRKLREEGLRNTSGYSAWVDDITLSGKRPSDNIGRFISALGKNGFRISRNKLRILSESNRRVVTGILLSTKPTIEREKIAQIRSGIHKIAVGEITKKKRKRYLRRLRGSIQYVKSVDAAKGQRLDEALRHALRAGCPIL